MTAEVNDVTSKLRGTAARCKPKTGRHNQDRSRRATNHRRILTRPVLILATGVGFATRPRTQKKSPKIAIWAPSHNFVGLYLRNYGTYRQSEKNLLSSNISSTCPHNMVNFGPLAAEIVSLVWGTPANFNGFGVLAALLHGI